MLWVQDDKKDKIVALPCDLNRMGTWQSVYRHVKSTVKQMWEQVVLSGSHYCRTASVIFKAQSTHTLGWALSSIISSRLGPHEVSQRLFFIWADCSCLWNVDDKKSAYVDITPRSNINLATVQPATYDEYVCKMYMQNVERDKSKRKPPLLNLWMNVSTDIFLNEPVLSFRCENDRG